MCPDRVEDDVISAVLSQHYKVCIARMQMVAQIVTEPHMLIGLQGKQPNTRRDVNFYADVYDFQVMTVVFDTESPHARCTGGYSIINFLVRGTIDGNMLDAASLLLGAARVEVVNASNSRSSSQLQNESITLNLRFVVHRYFDDEYFNREEARAAAEAKAKEENDGIMKTTMRDTRTCRANFTHNNATMALHVASNFFCDTFRLTHVTMDPDVNVHANLQEKNPRIKTNLSASPPYPEPTLIPIADEYSQQLKNYVRACTLIYTI